MAISFPSFGGKTPETKLSMREIIDKMHNIMGHINSLVGKHAAITDPLQRAEIEAQIAEKLYFLQDFTAKFGKAFLDRVGRNAMYTSKLLSQMELRTLFSRYPNPVASLRNYQKTSIANLDQFAKEAREDMERWYGLRRHSSTIKGRVKSEVSKALVSIKRNVSSVQKAREKASLKEVADAGIKEAGIKAGARQGSKTKKEVMEEMEVWKRLHQVKSGKGEKVGR
jgi:hypothetical protein